MLLLLKSDCKRRGLNLWLLGKQASLTPFNAGNGETVFHLKCKSPRLVNKRHKYIGHYILESLSEISWMKLNDILDTSWSSQNGVIYTLLFWYKHTKNLNKNSTDIPFPVEFHLKSEYELNQFRTNLVFSSNEIWYCWIPQTYLGYYKNIITGYVKRRRGRAELYDHKNKVLIHSQFPRDILLPLKILQRCFFFKFVILKYQISVVPLKFSRVWKDKNLKHC